MTEYKYTVIKIYLQDLGGHEEIKSFENPEQAFELKDSLTEPHDGYNEIIIEKV
jgi:hypothetical protein